MEGREEMWRRDAVERMNRIEGDVQGGWGKERRRGRSSKGFLVFEALRYLCALQVQKSKQSANSSA